MRGKNSTWNVKTQLQAEEEWVGKGNALQEESGQGGNGGRICNPKNKKGKGIVGRYGRQV